MKRVLSGLALGVTAALAAPCTWAAGERPPASEAPVRSEPARPAARDDTGSRTIGTTIDDAAITAKVKAALIADALTKARNIDVDTARATVTLKGIVHDKAEAERAVEIAKRTDGVQAVRNALTIGN